ncbi:MAG TPA: methylated-DNA--[protein]-cysteine S-methyltransferase [Candidatus Wirthbacteria bacterium]|nr:methylated-DNA--[protein]-cysteine S-methyltransferase [Candidatus Wirthbacteria bacterium]
MMETLYVSQMDSPLGNIYLGATKKGVCKISLQDEAGFYDWLFKHVDAVEAKVQNYYQIKSVKVALRRLFAGRSAQAAGLTLDLRGSIFQVKVWQVLLDIPFGQTSTYGELADQIGYLNAARAVGQACGANPLPLLVPCHRVVGADGKMGGYAAGTKVKEYLLKLEGALLV